MTTIKRTHEVIALEVPQDLSVVNPLGRKGDYLRVTLGKFTDEELQKIGDQFTKDMIARAKVLRSRDTSPPVQAAGALLDAAAFEGKVKKVYY